MLKAYLVGAQKASEEILRTADNAQREQRLTALRLTSAVRWQQIQSAQNVAALKLKASRYKG